MRKLVFLVALIATATLFLTSCSTTIDQQPTQKDLNISVAVQKTIQIAVPITANRFSCSGAKLTTPKYLGSGYKDSVISITKDTVISASYLRDHGWYYFDANQKPVLTETAFTWFPDWLKTLGTWLFWLALLIFIFWLLWHLFSLLGNNLPATVTRKPFGHEAKKIWDAHCKTAACVKQPACKSPFPCYAGHVSIKNSGSGSIIINSTIPSMPVPTQP